jgi:hypothetical protein
VLLVWVWTLESSYSIAMSLKFWALAIGCVNRASRDE